jgi:hypothetical protein
MMRAVFGVGLTVVVAFLPAVARAQEFTVGGVVVNNETGEPLQYAVVGIPELMIWDLSSETGAFTLEGVLPGVYRFIANRRGYYLTDLNLRLDGPVEFEVQLTPEDPREPVVSGAITGAIRDQASGQPIDGVEIMVEPTGQEASTDSQGRFEIRDISAGALRLTFRRIGYQPRVDTVASFPGVSLDLQLTMSAQAIPLEPLVVTARAAYLEANGFYRRGRTRRGQQYGADEVQRLGYPDLTRLFVIPGTRVERGRMGQPVLVNTREGNCEFTVWIDGSPVRGIGLNEINAAWVEAVEVYTGIDTPPEFSDRCGVILIWSQQ